MDPITEPDLRLLPDWSFEGTRARSREAAIASVSAHIALVTLLALLPNGFFFPAKRIVQAHKITPLVAPPFELTQPTPNKGKISKSINMESLLPRPSVQPPRSPRSTTRPAAQTPAPQPAPFVAPQTPQMPEPPKIDTAINEGPLVKSPIEVAQAPPPPQIQAEEKPKLTFETPGTPSSAPRAGTGKLANPNTIAEMVRSMPRSGAGGVIVGDLGSGAGGLGDGLNLPPSPGKPGSNLELLSDPMGVDFRPYMLQVLAMVRRNWFAIMPESAKLGSRGKVALQFSIDRQGQVPKLVIVGPSGIQALDRAAVAGVSASNPFPPLPSEFRGTQIRLQLVFSYNVPAN